MIRSLKTLGLAVVAVLALTAVAAAGASASSFDTGAEHTKYTAEADGNQVFTTEAGTVTCTAVTGTATTKSATQNVANIKTTKVEYTGCKTKTIFGEISVTVDFTTNGCQYNFTATEGKVHLECTKEEGVIINGPGCKITVPSPQTFSSVTYDNIGSGATADVTITANVTNIKSTSSGAFCSKSGTFTNGKYVGNVTIKGFNESGGAQVGIKWTA